ncbi:hypothetical protein B0H17DRAFT_1269328 [Mycena rosella]|uniref:Uncharacterized protein n=1 Tax=Mycena rosella TaxID=1033263 RepID=A0AAD7DR29_MYCRO|nr:hypothetical protein B0H17DRAFT_1269328 [Mycena rosella]
MCGPWGTAENCQSRPKCSLLYYNVTTVYTTYDTSGKHGTREVHILRRGNVFGGVNEGTPRRMLSIRCRLHGATATTYRLRLCGGRRGEGTRAGAAPGNATAGRAIIARHHSESRRTRLERRCSVQNTGLLIHLALSSTPMAARMAPYWQWVVNAISISTATYLAIRIRGLIRHDPLKESYKGRTQEHCFGATLHVPEDFWRCKSSQQPPPVMLPPAPREEDAQETLEGVRVMLSTLPKAVEGCRTRANQAPIRLPAAL